MSIQQYLNEMKKIQQNLLDFLENETDDEEYFQNLLIFCDEQKTIEDKHKLASLLHLLLKISNNHHRGPNFFLKIENILKQFKNQIIKQFSNLEIFHIFKSNKRILLFLIEEKMMIIDEHIFKIITLPKYQNLHYPQFFSPELESFTKNSMDKLPLTFFEDRKNGENENYVCKLIQKDSVQEFIAFVNLNNFSLKSTIKPSIFDTNPFFIIKPKPKQNKVNKSQGWGTIKRTNDSNIKDDELTLIKYAAFFGSIQIFRYLQMNGVQLTPSLWLYVIHSNNPELIHLLEENHIEPQDKNYHKCYLESIKCHHNDMAAYFLNNYMKNTQKNYDLIQRLKSYNFAYLLNNEINESIFISLVKYDYFLPLKIIQCQGIDRNKTINGRTIKINTIFI